MRIAITITGILILAVGVAFILDSQSDSSLFLPALLILGFGGLNLAFGIATSKSSGVSTLSNGVSGVKMIVDRGVIGSTIYVMTFSEAKLVLKKLTSGSVTIMAVLLFALVGFFVGFIIGAAVGGITAFSLQEFLTQRRRDTAIRGDLLTPSSKGDMEFVYADLDRIQLTRARLRLFLKNGILGIVISRKYPEKMWPVLQKIIPPSKIREAS